MCLLESQFSVFSELFGKGWKLLSSVGVRWAAFTPTCWQAVERNVVQCEVKVTARNGSAMKVLSDMERAQLISGSGMVSHKVTRTTLVVLVLFLSVFHPRIQQFWLWLIILRGSLDTQHPPTWNCSARWIPTCSRGGEQGALGQGEQLCPFTASWFLPFLSQTLSYPCF